MLTSISKQLAWDEYDVNQLGGSTKWAKKVGHKLTTITLCAWPTHC